MEQTFEQVLDMFSDEVKLVIKNYPLKKHKFAKKAARAALAAKVQGKFWEFHHKLFQNYKSINDGKIQDIARELNLDMVEFNKDMNSKAVQHIIDRDLQNGRRIGVRGTPTVYINGKRLNDRKISGFTKMIEAELSKK